MDQIVSEYPLGVGYRTVPVGRDLEIYRNRQPTRYVLRDEQVILLGIFLAAFILV